MLDSRFDKTRGGLERSRYEIKVRKINALFARKDYDKALNVTLKLIRKYPSHPNLYNTVGEIYLCLNQIDPAIRNFKKALKLDVNYADGYFNLGSAYALKGRTKEASINFQNAIQLIPNSADAYFNLGLIAQQRDQLQAALKYYQKAVEFSHNIPDAHNNIGVILNRLNDPFSAVKAYKKALSLLPDSAEFHNNIGLVYEKLGELDLAKESFESAISNNPKIAEIFNNYGNALLENGELSAARESYLKALELNASYTEAVWNLSGTATTIDEHISTLENCLQIDRDYRKAELMLASIQAYLGDQEKLNNLLESPFRNHPYLRSTIWLIGLKFKPQIHFNRWQFYDSVSELTQPTRPFYEFGVWRGASFKYLIKIYKQGYGFDTFTGIPENWDNLERGSYSSHGKIPKIKGGEFIAGHFDETLPSFFSEERPKASVINIDSDLYESAKSVLMHAQKVIDESTIIIFDEFLMNEKWENDERKALEEFCLETNTTFEVVAVSLFTKQVAVKVVKSIIR